MVWGKAPVFVKAAYSMTDASTGKVVRKSSLLLASGWWGIARHLQYAFELTAVR
jgi:7-dehydrocholesterol reductase